jgi:hypothetical protein
MLNLGVFMIICIIILCQEIVKLKFLPLDARLLLSVSSVNPRFVSPFFAL